MKTPNSADRLRHVLDAIAKIERYTNGVTRDEFLHLGEKVDAVVRNIEIVGEAINSIDRGIKSRHPEVDWRIATATRNRLIHGYFDVDPEIIWDTATVDLPTLKKQIEKILDELSK
jgi:uncharacterized protein with HEPN domain